MESEKRSGADYGPMSVPDSKPLTDRVLSQFIRGCEATGEGLIPGAQCNDLQNGEFDMGMLDDLAEGAYYATTGSDPKRAKNRDRRAGGGRISSRMTADFSLEGSLEGELDLVQTYNNFGIRNASGRKGQSKGAGTEKASRGRDRSGLSTGSVSTLGSRDTVSRYRAAEVEHKTSKNRDRGEDSAAPDQAWARVGATPASPDRTSSTPTRRPARRRVPAVVSSPARKLFGGKTVNGDPALGGRSLPENVGKGKDTRRANRRLQRRARSDTERPVDVDAYIGMSDSDASTVHDHHHGRWDMNMEMGVTGRLRHPPSVAIKENSVEVSASKSFMVEEKSAANPHNDEWENDSFSDEYSTDGYTFYEEDDEDYDEGTVDEGTLFTHTDISQDVMSRAALSTFANASQLLINPADDGEGFELNIDNSKEEEEKQRLNSVIKLLGAKYGPAPAADGEEKRAQRVLARFHGREDLLIRFLNKNKGPMAKLRVRNAMAASQRSARQMMAAAKKTATAPTRSKPMESKPVQRKPEERKTGDAEKKATAKKATAKTETRSEEGKAEEDKAKEAVNNLAATVQKHLQVKSNDERAGKAGKTTAVTAGVKPEEDKVAKADAPTEHRRQVSVSQVSGMLDSLFKNKNKGPRAKPRVRSTAKKTVPTQGKLMNLSRTDTGGGGVTIAYKNGEDEANTTHETIDLFA